VALRHGRRWLPEYEQLQASPSDEQLPGAELLPGTELLPGSELLREGGVYLITGGLGGIALGLAERLARDCRAKLVLLARTGLPEREQWPALLAQSDGTESAGLGERVRERIGKVQALLELGAEVEIVTGDVSDPDDVRRAYQIACEKFGGLHGVARRAADRQAGGAPAGLPGAVLLDHLGHRRWPGPGGLLRGQRVLRQHRRPAGRRRPPGAGGGLG
jgi:hypothetical protein